MKTENEIIKELTAAFVKMSGAKEPALFFAPGRINLIGEHIDYNGGHVLPCALSLGTYAAAAKRDDDRIRLYSENFAGAGVLEFKLSDCVSQAVIRPEENPGNNLPESRIHGANPRQGEGLSETEARMTGGEASCPVLPDAGRKCGWHLPEGAKDSWVMYPLGVVCALADRGICLDSGFDMAVFGNLPSGAGLSSSASLEVLTAFALRQLFGFELENKEIALVGRRAENEYCGMHCGIMDQFAVAMAREGCAIYLNTDTLGFEYVPLGLSGAKLVISNTNKKHRLAGSAYNDRRSECEQAFKVLAAAIDRGLADAPEQAFPVPPGHADIPVFAGMPGQAFPVSPGHADISGTAGAPEPACPILTGQADISGFTSTPEPAFTVSPEHADISGTVGTPEPACPILTGQADISESAGTPGQAFPVSPGHADIFGTAGTPEPARPIRTGQADISGSAGTPEPARREINCLCDITPELFEQYKNALADPVLKARARHVVYENERTKEAAAALKSGDLERMGQLMCEAHVSISKDFEVSCAELDILQEEAMKIPGVWGSRMSGGGFGGCTVSVVKDEAVPEFIEKVGAAYLARVGYAADFYIAAPSGGPREVRRNP